jgi:hypothetical protein
VASTFRVTCFRCTRSIQASLADDEASLFNSAMWVTFG